jgi:hypothetical protein
VDTGKMEANTMMVDDETDRPEDPCTNCDHKTTYFATKYFHVLNNGVLAKECDCGCTSPSPAKQKGDIWP